MNLSKIRKIATSSLGKRILAGVLSTLMVITPVIPSFAETASGAFKGTDLDITMINPSRPIINMKSTKTGAQGGYQYNNSNGFQMVTGQAIEKSQANRPQPPIDPSTEPGFNDLTPEQQAEKRELYQEALAKYPGEVADYFRDRNSWKKPGIDFTGADFEGGKLIDFTLAPGLSNTVTKTTLDLFDSAPTVEEQEGSGFIKLKGKAKANPALDLEVIFEVIDRQDAAADDPTNFTTMKDRANYIVKVTNPLPASLQGKDQFEQSDLPALNALKAEVFGLSWNVDTWIINQDSAPFFGKGINQFSTANVTIGFPTNITNNLSEQQKRDLFGVDDSGNGKDPHNDNIPEYLYASNNAAGADLRVAIIYPQANASKTIKNITNKGKPALNSSGKPFIGTAGEEDAKYWEVPNYFGMGAYSPIHSTGNVMHYFWHAATSNGSSDSGHIVRYEPKVVLPGETLYFGVTYGNATVDTKNPNGPYLLKNNPDTDVTVSNNEYGTFGLDLRYGNTGATVHDAEIVMYLPKEYIVADPSMETSNISSEKWIRQPNSVTKNVNNKDVECYVWRRKVGTLERGESSITKPVILRAYPQRANRNDGQRQFPDGKGVIPAYAFELEYATTPGGQVKVPVKGETEYTYTHKDVAIRLPYLAPVNLRGTIWRDLDGNGQLITKEGLLNVVAKIPSQTDKPATDKTEVGGVLKFVNGYASDTNPEYTVSFNLDPPNNARMEKYIWTFDKDYTFEKSKASLKDQYADNDKPLVDAMVEDGQYYAGNPEDKINGLNIIKTRPDAPSIFEKFEPGEDELGNVNFTFKLDPAQYDGSLIDFRVKEVLAGKVNIYPYLDQNNDHQYQPTDSYIKKGLYKLTGPSANKQGEATNENDKHKIKLPAFDNYKLTYNAPYGFRTIDGLRIKDINLQNLESLFQKPNGTDVPIELIAKDIRFADSVGNDTEYPDMIKEPKGTLQANGDLVVKLDSQAAPVEHTLLFNAWNGADGQQKPLLIDPASLNRAGDFNWELTSDTGILEAVHDQGKLSSDGKITIKPDASGEAKIKVSWKDNPNIFDIVTVKVKKPQPPIEQPGEQILGFVIEPDANIAVGRKSPLLTLKARVQKADGTEELREVHPDQLDEFTSEGANQFEIIPPQGDSKKFQVKGLGEGGPYNYHIKYKDQTYTPTGTVTVTAHNFTPQSHRLELTPEIVRVKVNETLDVAYKLASLVDPQYDQANAETLLTQSDFLEPKAEFENGVKTKIKGLAVGTTTLKLAVGNITKDVTVIVYDDNTPPPADGKIGFEEIAPKKNGLLKPNEEAKYKLFLDTNGDGIKQPNEEYLKNSDNVQLSPQGAHVTVAPAPGSPNSPLVAVVTGVTPGADALKAKVNLPSGRVYEGEEPLTVVPDASALNELKLEPEQIIIKQGETNEQMIVKADYQPPTGEVELERNLYNLNFAPNGIASEYGDKSGKNIRIKGDNVGITDVKATFEGKEVAGKVIVIPADTKLVIKDEPIWVKKNENKTPEIEFVSNGQPLPQELQDVLKPLVRLESEDPSVAAATPTKELNGAEIGRTKITASLPNFPGIKDTKDIFVYDDGALKIPDTELVTNQIKSVPVQLVNGTQITPVPAKYVRLKVVDPTIADLDINSVNTMIPPTAEGRVVRGDLAKVKGISTVGTRDTKLIATIPSENLTAEGNIRVLAGYTFEGPLTVQPSRVDLWNEDDKVEIIVKDKNGREVPPDLLTGLTPQDPTKNEVLVEDGRIFVKKKPGTTTEPNSLTIGLTGDANPPASVTIVNHDANTQGQEHILEVPDFAMAVSETKDLRFDQIMVRPKTGGAAKPLSDYITDRTNVFVQPNNQLLNGKVSIADPDTTTPNAADIVKVFTGVVPGASSYKVTVTLPGTGEILSAEGKLAIHKDMQRTKKLVVVKSVFNPSTGLMDAVPLQPGEEVPVNTPLSVQLHLTDPYDPSDVQVVSGAALPYFVDDLKPAVGSNFKISTVGELIQKVPTNGADIQVTGTLVEPTGPALEDSQPFKLSGVQPIVPKPGPIKVEPKQLLIPVNGTGTITGITYADGTPVPANKISIRPANPAIADNGATPNTIDGKTPGDTEVYVVVEGYPPVKVPVKVYDETNANVGVNPDPNDPNIGANPNDPNYPGGFPVPNEIVMVPVGGEVPFVLDINGVPVSADEFDVVVNSGGMTTHSAIDMSTGKISGITAGTDTAEFTLKSNPNIKKVLKIVVFDPNVATVPSIRITDKPIVFRQNGDSNVMINAVVDLNGAPNATVMWIVEDVGVASFAGTNSLTEPSSSNPAHSVSLNWETNAPRTTKLTAIVLESGKLDTTILSGKEIEVDYIDYIAPKPLEAEKDIPKSLDAMGPFNIKMYDNNGNEYPLSIADFDVVGADGPITLSGPDNRIITATGVGPKTLKLRHKTSGKEIEVPVSIPEDATANQAVITFDPNGGTLTGPATQMVEKGRPANLPIPTRPGYTFDGWYDASGRRYDSSTPITADVALTARWTQSGGGSSGGGGGGGGQPSAPKPAPTPTPTPAPVPTPTPGPSGDDKGYIELNKNAKFAYITGYPDKTVKAGAPITRAEVSAIFARLMKSAILMDENYRSQFGDVRSGVWYTNYIGYLEGFNILTGYPDGSFRPNNHITRAEFAVIISKFAQLKTDTPSKFKDVNDSHWAKKYVDNAVAQGWMGGYPDGSFKPNQPITRAEVVTVVNKMIERSPQKDSLSKSDRYKDLKQDYWAYADVLEASTDHTVGSNHK